MSSGFSSMGDNDKSRLFSMVQIDNLRTIKTLFYLNFDPGGVSRARKLKMKHEKITNFRHYVPWTIILEDMNKSQVCIFWGNGKIMQHFLN